MRYGKGRGEGIQHDDSYALNQVHGRAPDERRNSGIHRLVVHERHLIDVPPEQKRQDALKSGERCVRANKEKGLDFQENRQERITADPDPS